MRGSRAKQLRRIAKASAPRDITTWQMLEGRSIRGHRFIMYRVHPECARSMYKQLKRAWKGLPLTQHYGEMK